MVPKLCRRKFLDITWENLNPNNGNTDSAQVTTEGSHLKIVLTQMKGEFAKRFFSILNRKSNPYSTYKLLGQHPISNTKSQHLKICFQENDIE